MKKHVLYAALLLAVVPTRMMAQEQPEIKISNDSLSNEVLDEVLINTVRAGSRTPMAYSNLSKKELAKRNLGQDIPVLMNFMPSVVTTTDAGNGVGYTGIRVRGSDATRVNVTINGIPYNDSESQGTFWVNMPDFASSIENLQLQRGVGTSTNGSGAFGASLNMLTDAYSHDPYGEIANSIGSFSTRKHTVKFSTGLVNDAFELSGRLSELYSDGYIDRASSKLKSYFLQGNFVNEGTLIKALVFGGKEKTYQAWNGVSQEEIDTFGRRYNPSGAYIDDNGQQQFYDNETDNYKQDHYQLHWNERWNAHWSSNFALHYTKGFGYYENYKANDKLKTYGFQPLEIDGKTISKSDVIRQKILDNHFYGFTFGTTYKAAQWDVVLGGAANKYEGDHLGRILWVKAPVDYTYNQEYYKDHSTKTDANVYTKATYTLDNLWVFYADLQYRNVTYKANGKSTGIVDDHFSFFNPKAGITYLMNENNQVYASYARAHREPSRNDYENGNPKPEQLNDFELGWKLNQTGLKLNVNAYMMLYKDQLVLTGALNDVGSAIRENSGKSYRMGLEIDAAIALSKQWTWQPSLTLSSNKNVDFYNQWDGEVVELGKTDISFSPNVIASNGITYQPIAPLQISLLSKYVGSQYMSNTEAASSKLKSYFVNDLNVSYEWVPSKWFKAVAFNVMANNIFNVKYISNGFYYTYDDVDSQPGKAITYDGTGYYPQAQFHLLAGITLKF